MFYLTHRINYISDVMVLKNIYKILFVLTIISAFQGVFAQDNTKTNAVAPLQIIFPKESDWNVLDEGKEINFHLQTKGGKGDSVRYNIVSGLAKDMKFDSLGHFVWVPGYDVADRINTTKFFPVVFEAQTLGGETASREIIFKVNHVNRPPQVDELKPFYVQYKTQNLYQIDMNSVRDPDGDPVVFIPILDGGMPEAMKLTASGEVIWELSTKQFNLLKEGARYMEFYVEDQPSKARTKGRLRLEITQMDLAPDFTIIPQNQVIRSPENNRINLRFSLSDPNGEDDIATFNFISENKNVPKEALVKNTPTNYEFIWEPGYDFVKDPFDTLAFNITFYVMDKSQNKKEKTVRFVIKNTIDESQRDAYVYGLYKGALVNAWGLLEQMREREGELKKAYTRAKKGKRSRSLLNASLGATTGLAPVIATDPKNRGYITTIGGTTVATVGTLEATEVIGKSTNGLLDRFNYVVQKKNELQNKGDVFAREYAQKSSRRAPDFIKKLDEFKALMNLSGLVALELDANWENKREATDAAIKKAFKDFMPFSKDEN
jgi:hypothetical protein